MLVPLLRVSLRRSALVRGVSSVSTSTATLVSGAAGRPAISSRSRAPPSTRLGNSTPTRAFSSGAVLRDSADDAPTFAGASSGEPFESDADASPNPQRKPRSTSTSKRRKTSEEKMEALKARKERVKLRKEKAKEKARVAREKVKETARLALEKKKAKALVEREREATKRERVREREKAERKKVRAKERVRKVKEREREKVRVRKEKVRAMKVPVAELKPPAEFPKTPYMHFVSQGFLAFKAERAAAGENAKLSEYLKIAGGRWAELSEEQKATYETPNWKEEMAAYTQARKEWYEGLDKRTKLAYRAHRKKGPAKPANAWAQFMFEHKNDALPPEYEGKDACGRSGYFMKLYAETVDDAEKEALRQRARVRFEEKLKAAEAETLTV